MRAKPVDIGNTVRRNLIAFRRSGEPVAPPSEHDAGNGAAMRVLPVALATLGQREDAVRAAVRAQAHVTHNNPDSDAACEFLALAVQEGMRGGALRGVYRRGIQPFVAAASASSPTARAGARTRAAGWSRPCRPSCSRCWLPTASRTA